jgi:hypothetical protein
LHACAERDSVYNERPINRAGVRLPDAPSGPEFTSRLDPK